MAYMQQLPSIWCNNSSIFGFIGQIVAAPYASPAIAFFIQVNNNPLHWLWPWPCRKHLVGLFFVKINKHPNG
jgi:hypothetical protein